MAPEAVELLLPGAVAEAEAAADIASEPGLEAGPEVGWETASMAGPEVGSAAACR